eukprot:jgi/Botrbrau1/14884/Bobra.0248s0003.1
MSTDERTAVLARAKKLLLGSDAQAQARWQLYPDAALDEAIVNYQTSLREVTDALLDAGAEVDRGDRVTGGNSITNGTSVPAFSSYQTGNVDDLDPQEWQVPPHCIPIHANVTTFDWSRLYSVTQFDVIMMDPPWQLATANPTRGVALGYSQLTDTDITALPIPKLQSDGFLFIWVINAKYKFTLDLFRKWGYTIVDEIVWVKMTVNRRIAKSHGYYLQHAKEVCLVGKKGADPPGLNRSIGSDIIVAERRGQSQKPEEIYQLIEELVPQGRYLEIFGRKNNLHNYWVTLGNEVTGTGFPEDDVAALKEKNRIPGAVYGRHTNH